MCCVVSALCVAAMASEEEAVKMAAEAMKKTDEGMEQSDGCSA